VALGAAVYIAYTSYNNYQNILNENKTLSTQLTNPDTSKKAQEEKAKEVLDKLEKVLFVENSKDSDEKEVKPAVATIQDKEKVKQSNQEFYKYVENGDYLIRRPGV
jgi:cell division protein FtsB